MLEVEAEIPVTDLDLAEFLQAASREFGYRRSEIEQAERTVYYCDTDDRDLLLAERSFKLQSVADAGGVMDAVFKRPVDKHGKLLVRERVGLTVRAERWKQVTDLVNELMWDLSGEFFVEPRLLVAEESGEASLTGDHGDIAVSCDRVTYGTPEDARYSAGPEEEHVLELEADGVSVEELLEVIQWAQEEIGARPAPEDKYARGMRKLDLWPEGETADAGIDLSIE